MKKVHLMGVGGSGMASLAGMFQEKGWSVQGSDQKIYPPASTELEKMKIEVFDGFKPENLQGDLDLVVVGNVISRGNPEADALLKSQIPYRSMAGALAEHFISGHRSVVVTGTHGKTSTTSLLAWILQSGGMKPGFFVGGVPTNFGQGYCLGSGDPFVLEGDEYDTAFFEKTPKFLHYVPRDIIVSSIEFDHADIYRDLDHVVEQFEKLVSILPENGSIVACGDHPIIRQVVSKRDDLTVQFYGFDEKNDWRADLVKNTKTGKSFDVLRRGKPVTWIDSSLLGDQYILNTLGAVAMAEHLGLDLAQITAAVRTFRGVKRRQEFLGEASGIRVYDDFAHHPTAIAQTLAGFKPLAEANGGKLWAIFEPRSNTVRRRVFEKTLPASFMLADEAILSPVYRKKDSLKEEELLQPQEVADAIRKNGKRALAASSMDEILEKVVGEAHSGDVVLFMSNGSFDNLPRRTLEKLKSRDT